MHARPIEEARRSSDRAGRAGRGGAEPPLPAHGTVGPRRGSSIGTAIFPTSGASEPRLGLSPALDARAFDPALALSSADPTGRVFSGFVEPKLCGMRGFAVTLKDEESDDVLFKFDATSCVGFCDKYEVKDSR